MPHPLFKTLHQMYLLTMQNFYNLTSWNSVHIFDIFNCYSANINGMWNTRRLGGISKTLDFVLAYNMHMKVWCKSTLNSSKFIQCFNQWNCSRGIYYCEKSTESKLNVKYVNTVKSPTK